MRDNGSPVGAFTPLTWLVLAALFICVLIWLTKTLIVPALAALALGCMVVRG